MKICGSLKITPCKLCVPFASFKTTAVMLWWLYNFFLMTFEVYTVCAASWENQQSAYAKTKAQIRFAVTAKLISAFVFATRIVQSLYFLNTKFHASSCLLLLCSPVCVGPGQKPHCWFSHETAQFYCKQKNVIMLQ